MATSKYTVFLIYLWLQFLIFFPGCDYRIQNDDSINFQVNLSPAMTEIVQQKAVECVVCIGDHIYRFPIDHKHEEYNITPGISGETIVMVQYLDSEGSILLCGKEFVDINMFGRTDVIVELDDGPCDPCISLDPTSDVRGCPVTVKGQNFGANELIQIDFGIIKGIAETSTDEKGEFNKTFLVPEDYPVAYGKVTVSARGLSSGYIAQNIFTLEHSQGELESSKS